MFLVTNCYNCGLAGGRTSIVNGRGTRKNPIVFVGEAPGKDEDEQAKPFVGSAGRVLMAMLKDAGISVSEAYFTNVCRCRPPGNRTPTYAEIEACREHLKEELKSLEPRFVVALGDTASYALTGKKTNPYRGSFVTSEYVQCPVLITSHPAKSFHERYVFDIVVWDLQKLYNYEQEQKPTQYLVNPHDQIIEQWMKKAVDTEATVAVDIETMSRTGNPDDGLNPRRGYIEGIGFCIDEGVALHLSGNTLERNWWRVKQFLENPWLNLVFQNNRFDRAFLLEKDIVCKCWWDTMTGMYLFNPDFPHRNLDFLRSLHTQILPYKHAYWSGTSTIDLGHYNCLDVDVTWQVAQAQLTFVDERLMTHMMNESDVAMHMTRRGVYIDQKKLAAHYLDNKPAMDQLEHEFGARFGANIASPKQLSELLYGKFGCQYHAKSQKKTQISVDDTALEFAKKHLVGGRDNHPDAFTAIDMVQEYRDRAKVVATYCEGIARLIEDDGRVHAQWKCEGTDTGRWSCKDPNFQNIPILLKDVICPEPGRVLYYADYDRLEVWVAALLSGDKDLLEILESGTDIHSVLQKEIAKEYPAITRTQAKTTLFGTFYGRGTRTIAEAFGVKMEVAKLWQDLIFGRFTKLGEFFRKRIPEEFSKNGYMTSFFGRVKYADAITKAMNFPIQSAASDVLNNALVALHRAGFHIILNQHDAVVCEEPDTSRWDEFLTIVQTSSPTLKEIFHASGGMGYHWKELTDDKMHEEIDVDIEDGRSRDWILAEHPISDLAYDTLFGG